MNNLNPIYLNEFLWFGNKDKGMTTLSKLNPNKRRELANRISAKQMLRVPDIYDDGNSGQRARMAYRRNSNMLGRLGKSKFSIGRAPIDNFGIQ